MKVKVYHHLDELPDRYESLFESAGEASFFHSRTWFHRLIDATSNAGDSLRLYGTEADDERSYPTSLLVARTYPARLGPIPQRVLESFSNFYTIKGGPVIGVENAEVDRDLTHLVSKICSERPRWDIVLLKELDPDSVVFQCLTTALRNSGMIVQPFFQYGRWFEEIEGRSFEDYIGDRGTAIRKKLQWKDRKIAKSDRFRYELITDETRLDEAISDYQKVYEHSWKEPETYPNFIPGLIRDCARLGTLRLGLMYFDGEPIATQLTFLSGGTAFQYKMAYDEKILKNSYTKNLSIGSIMLLRLMKHLINVDKIKVFDIGGGDEKFKLEWCTQHSENWGVMAFNSRTAMGLINALRHVGGAFASAAWRRILGR